MYFDLVAFGERLKALRKGRKLSQEKVADELGVSTIHYKHIENGQVGCSIDLLLILSEKYDVTTDYLLTGTNMEKKDEIEQLKKAIEILTKLIQS